ncbi:MAG: hypothetical protein ABI608_05575 [Rhizomicrobium sp.]
MDPKLPPLLPQLSALGLYRAIPYMHDTALISLVCRRIERVLET